MLDYVGVGVLRTVFVGISLCLLSPTGSIAATLKIGGTGSALGTMRALGEAFIASHPDVSIEIPDSVGSSGGIRAMIAGAMDIGLTSRPLKDKEREAGVKQIPYAKSPFVLVTSSNHAEAGLTSRNVIEIFAGDQSYWSDGTPIRLILRPESDGDSRILVSAFAGIDAALAKARKTQGIPVAYTDQDALDMAESVAGPLTTATLAAIVTENRSLVPIAIDGVAPTVENLANGSYTIAKTLYLIIGPNVSQLAMEFVHFVESAAGAAILRETGNLAIAASG